MIRWLQRSPGQELESRRSAEVEEAREGQLAGDLVAVTRLTAEADGDAVSRSGGQSMQRQLDVDTVELEMTPQGLDTWGCTHVGFERRENQDRFLIADLTKAVELTPTSLRESPAPRSLRKTCGQLMLVADGMGGHQGGEMASSLVAEEVAQRVLETLPWCSPARGETHDLEYELVAILEASQRRVEQAQAGNPSVATMGTTLTLAYLVWPWLHLVHVGDSRCYLLREGELERLTTDHNVAQRMVEDGLLEPDEVSRSPYRHVLWNAIGGGSSELEPDVSRVRLARGDRLLLCSDGVTAHVPDDLIRQVLVGEAGSETACRRLEQAALDGGGSDNISVIVCSLSDAT